MKAAELFVRCLENEEVKFIFGLPGEENIDIMDALLDSSIRFITTRHEQAAAFMADTGLGIVTALAIIAHEIPQEVGDFVILLHSGYSKAKAFTFNLISSGATLLGGLLAYFALRSMQDWVPTLLGLAAASMIYVAVADLIPGLHRRPELRATLEQVVLISLGIGSIALVRFFVNGIA